MKKMTFALCFCNRGFMPGELIYGAREDMVKAVTAAGYDYIMMDAELTRYGGVETRDEGRLYAKWLKEHQGQYDGVIFSMPIFADENGAITAVHTNRGTVHPKIVINAAGVFADDIAEMAHDRFYSIHPRRGTNSIQDKKAADKIDTIASVQHISLKSTKTHSKGGGLIRTAHDNILAGPDAVECFEKEVTATTPESIKTVYDKQKKTVPSVSERDIITYFTGVRAPTFEEDFVIEWGRKCKNIFHCGGIQSPGLTAAPAFAIDVAQMVADRLSEQMTVTKNENFNPNRRGVPVLKDMPPEKRAAMIAENPDYGVIICRCEEISKGEIIDALNRPLCPPTVDGIKKRIRPGMGRCQGGFCSPLVTKIIAEHEGVSLSDVRKSSKESVILYGETKGGAAND